MITEIEKLASYLSSNGYITRTYYSIDGSLRQVDVYDDSGNKLWDAACSAITCGGRLGLLEVIGTVCRDDEEGFEGYLTADDIISRL